MPTIARRVLGLFLALAVALTPSVVSARDADWPQAGFDGGASRYNVSETRIRPSNVDRLQLDWARRIRPDVSFIYEQVADVEVVHDGRVFAAWAADGASYGIVAALEEASGRRLWARRFHPSARVVAADDTTLIVGVGSGPPSVRALDVQTGTLRWSRAASRPSVVDRAAHQLMVVESKGAARWLRSIEVASGGVAWSRRLRVRLVGWGGVRLSGGRVVVPVSTERGARLVCLRARDGSTIWSRRASGDPAVVAEGRIFMIQPSSEAPTEIVSAFALEDGGFLWRFRAPFFASVAAAGGGRVFVNHATCITGCEGEGFGLYRGGVVALDVRTGHVLWRRIGNEEHGTTLWWARALARGLVFVGRFAFGQGRLGALDASTGRQRWAVKVGRGDVFAMIDVVADGAVFGSLQLGPQAGRILRFALPRGR